MSYKQHSLVMNREISYTYNGEDKSGKVIDIDGDGGLVVQENGGGIRNLTCGEISIRSSANEWI